MTPAQAEALFDALILDHPGALRAMAIAETRVASAVTDRTDTSINAPCRNRDACFKLGQFLIEWGAALSPGGQLDRYHSDVFPLWSKLRDALKRIVTEGRGALDYQEADKLVAIAEEALK